MFLQGRTLLLIRPEKEYIDPPKARGTVRLLRTPPGISGLSPPIRLPCACLNEQQ